METSLPVFMVKKDKLIGGMSAVESLPEMFSSKSLLYEEINTPVYNLDPQLLSHLMKVIFQVYFRRLPDGQSMNELSYVEQNWYLAKYKVSLSCDAKEEEAYQEQEKKNQEVAKRKALRIANSQEGEVSESMLHSAAEMSVNMSSSALNMTNDSFSEDMPVRKVIIRYNTALQMDIKMLVPPGTGQQGEVFDGHGPEFLFQRHPNSYYKTFLSASALIFKKNKYTSHFEHLLFNQSLIYVFRMNVYNWMLKNGVIKDLNKKWTKTLNRLFFDRDRLFRKLIDRNLSSQIPGALVFDYYTKPQKAPSLQ